MSMKGLSKDKVLNDSTGMILKTSINQRISFYEKKDNSNKNWQPNKDWKQNIIIHYILYIRIAKIITSEKIIENAEW